MKINISISAEAKPVEILKVGTRVAVRTSKNAWYTGVIEKLRKPKGYTVLFNDGDEIVLDNAKTIKTIKVRGKKSVYTDLSVQALLVNIMKLPAEKKPIKVMKGGIKINSLQKFSQERFEKLYSQKKLDRMTERVNTEKDKKAKARYKKRLQEFLAARESKQKENEALQVFLKKYVPLVEKNKGAIFASDELVTPEQFEQVETWNSETKKVDTENKSVAAAVGKTEIYYLSYEHLWGKTGNWQTLQVYNTYKRDTFVVLEGTPTNQAVDDLTIILVAGDTSYTGHKRDWS